MPEDILNTSNSNKTINNKNIKVIVISSVSGGGKTTILQMLLKKYKTLCQIITITTRVPRENEKDGLDYFFYKKEDFEKLINNNELLEYAEVHGKYYGVPLTKVMEKLNNGIDVILNIDVQGLQNVYKKLGKDKVISIFLMPPSINIWKERLQNRKTESQEEIDKRLKQGHWEIEQSKHYDYVLVNDNLEKTFENVEEILKQNKII